MSWYRQVKTIYTATYLVFVFVCYSLAAGVFLKEKMNFTIYIFLLGSAVLMQYLTSKEKDNKLAVGVPCAIVALLNFITYPLEAFIIHTIFNTVIILFLNKQDEEDVNYDVYKDRMKQAIIILLPLGIIAPSARFNNLYWIFRFYILFLIFTIITLREARNYTNKIRNKKGTATNFAIIIMGIVACTNFVGSLLTKIAYYIYLPISFIITKLADILFRIIGVPLIMLWEKAIALLGKSNSNQQQLNQVQPAKELQEKYASDGSSLLPKIAAIVLIIFIVIVVIRSYKKLKVHHIKRNNNVDDLHKERIRHEGNSRKNNAFTNFFNKLFRRDGTVREQILYIYSRFQLQMKLKEIFKPYMTATQLSKVARINIDEYDALDSIKSIYNEAKFSEHNISKDNAVEMKTQYDKIKTRKS